MASPIVKLGLPNFTIKLTHHASKDPIQPRIRTAGPYLLWDALQGHRQQLWHHDGHSCETPTKHLPKNGRAKQCGGSGFCAAQWDYQLNGHAGKRHEEKNFKNCFLFSTLFPYLCRPFEKGT